MAPTDPGQMLADITAKHVVVPSLFANDPSAVAPVARRQDMVQMEPVYGLLDRVVGMPLANPIVAPCRSPIMACQGVAQSGALTAIQVWCATNSPRVNVITFKWTCEQECDRLFYMRLMEAAANAAPCILVIHRVTERAPAQAVPVIFNAIWQAYLRYFEQKIDGLPRFWLMFVDRHAPSQVLPNWDCIQHNAAIPPFSDAVGFLQSMIQQELRRLLLDEASVLEFVQFYEPIARQVTAENPGLFGHPRDVRDYVNHLFGLPPSRYDSAALRAMAGQVSVAQVLPQPDDFREAVVLLQRTKEETQRQRDARAQMADDERKAQHAHRMRQLTAARHT